MMDRIQPENRSRFVKHVVYILFSLVTTVSIFVYLFSAVSPETVFNAIYGISWRFAGFFLLFSILMSIARTWRDMILLNVSGYRPNPVAMYLVTLVRNFFSDLLPARIGTLIYIYLITHKLGISFGAATSSFAFSFLFDMISLSILVVFAVGSVASDFFSPVTVVAASVALLVVCIGVMVFLPGLFQWVAGMLNRSPFKSKRLFNRWAEAVRVTGEEVSKAIQSGIYFRVLMLSFLVRAGKYLSLYALLMAIVIPMGYNLDHFPLPKVFLGLCGAEMSASLPISGIAGFGVYEGAWALVFQMLGYSKEVSALTSIAHHLISQLYGYTLGAMALIFLLLPIFSGERETAGRIEARGYRFWYWFAGLTLITVGLTWLLLTPFILSRNAIAADGKSSETNVNKTISTSMEWQKEFPELSGKIVYEKPDGIHFERIGAQKAERLVSGGRYPRWSPDGKLVAYIKDNTIRLISVESRQERIVSSTESVRALAFHPGGKSIVFTDGATVRDLNIDSLRAETIAHGKRYLEIDISKDNSLLAYTTKRTFGGYQVELKNLGNQETKKISTGCSASLSPIGDFVTVNSESHRNLYIFDTRSGALIKQIEGPPGNRFDNHSWSNSNDWIAGVNESDANQICIIEVSSSRFWKVTDSGDADRPDVFIQVRDSTDPPVGPVDF